MCRHLKRAPLKALFNFTIQGSLLPRVSVVRDLGVLFDDDFLFKSHIEAVYNKALGTFGFIKKTTFDFKHAITIFYLYNSLVLPLLNTAHPTDPPSANLHRQT